MILSYTPLLWPWSLLCIIKDINDKNQIRRTIWDKNELWVLFTTQNLLNVSKRLLSPSRFFCSSSDQKRAIDWQVSLSSLPLLRWNWVAPKLDNKAAIRRLQRTANPRVNGPRCVFLPTSALWIWRKALKDFRSLKKKRLPSKRSNVIMASKADQLLIVVSILEGKRLKEAACILLSNSNNSSNNNPYFMKYIIQ